MRSPRNEDQTSALCRLAWIRGEGRIDIAGVGISYDAYAPRKHQNPCPRFTVQSPFLAEGMNAKE
jgi:hypothetical protein